MGYVIHQVISRVSASIYDAIHIATGFEIYSLWQGMVGLNHISYIPHMYSDGRSVSNRSLCGCYSHGIYCRKIGAFRRGMYISIEVQLSLINLQGIYHNQFQ